MPTTKAETKFEQVADARGRIRTDRPFDAQEAAEQDKRHREHALAERAKRFGVKES